MTRILLSALLLSVFFMLCSCVESPSEQTPFEQDDSGQMIDIEPADRTDNNMSESAEAKPTYSVDDYSDREPSQVVGVVYNGEFYGNVGVIFSNDELNEYMSQGKYIGESMPIDITDFRNVVDGEIVDADIVPKNELESQSSGCALYLIGDYIISAYKDPFYNETVVVPLEEMYSYGLISRKLPSADTEN